MADAAWSAEATPEPGRVGGAVVGGPMSDLRDLTPPAGHQTEPRP